MNPNSFPTIAALLVTGAVLLAGCHKGGGDTSGDEGDNVATVVSVQVGQLRRATLHAYVSGYGAVQPAPASTDTPAASAKVAPSQAGVVARVYVAVGQHVDKGAPLLDLDDRAARVAVKAASETAQRQKVLYAQHNTSLKALQEAESALATAEAQLALFHVIAPLAGTITHVNTAPGSAVDLTTVVAEITDLSRLVVSAEIPAGDAADLKPGESVELTGDKPVTTSLEFVSPAVDPTNDTVTVIALVPAASGLRAGTLVPLRITTGEHANVLAAPAESVVTNEAGDTVLSLVEKDEATQVPVKVGYRDNGLVEISGDKLKAGDTVVTVGAYGLPAKTQVQIAKP